MDPATMTLFRAVANRSSEEREEYYTHNQVSDKLRSEVESLLQAGDRTVDSFAGHLASAALKAILEDPVPPPQPAPSRPLAQPVSIGRYEVKRLLGRGGMSDVYLARDPMLERDIAVKLIGGELDSDVARRRLVREASAAGRLRHPNIVTIFDAGEHDGQPYIAMEYVPGETLRSLIRRRASLPLRQRLELIEGACAGLAHAHRAGVVHLDIKPDNLIVDETGVVKVLDFGIARVLSSEAIATRHIVGTLRYMSPEQIAGDPLDHRSDVFSLGCSLYEMLAYLPAYSGSTREIVYRIAVGPVPRLAEVAPDTDPRLDAAIAKAMALEQDERFADLEEFRSVLARLRDELDPVGDQPVKMADERLAEQSHTTAMSSTAQRVLQSRQQKTAAPPRRRTAAIVAAAAVVVAVAIGAYVQWGRGSETPQEPQVAAAPPPQSAPAAPVLPAPGPAAGSPAVDPTAADENEVWRRFGLSDREGVLTLLTKANAGRGFTTRLPYELVATVRVSVEQSRQTANATPGASSSEAYRLAEEQRGRANRLEDARDPVGALRAFWQASDNYVQAVNNSRANVTPPVTVNRDPGSGTREPELETRGPSPESRKPELPPPSPAPTPSTAVQPSSEPPPRIPAPAPSPAPAQEPVRVPSPTDAVLETLNRYAAAFRARDLNQLRLVYPSLSTKEVALLENTFKMVDEYIVEIREAQVQIQSADAASVEAVIVRRIDPKVGPAQTPPPANTRFVLRRMAAQWIITDVISRAQNR